MNCREGCGACCIAISISTPLPGMPEGKPSGIRCINLTDDYRCAIHESENYPDVCRKFSASREFCGRNREEALKNINMFEELTKP
jgi:uncharacterized protein